MGRRCQRRVAAIIPIRLWGIDRHGKPFCEHLCTLDITNHGARIVGLRASLSAGDIVGVQHRNRQARFRISWVGVHCSPTGMQIGLECLQPHKSIWYTQLPDGGRDNYEVPEVHPRRYEPHDCDRRSTTRYPVSGRALVSNSNGGQGIWAKLEDISRSGCYVTTAHPFGIGRKLDLELTVTHHEIKAHGVVRVCYPHCAMGIEFIQLSEPYRRVLHDLTAYLEEIENALSTLTPAPSSPDAPLQ